MEFIETLLDTLYTDNQSAWIIQVFIIVLFTLSINFFQKKIFTRLQKKSRHTKNKWDDLLVDSALRPLGFLIWLLGILFAAEVVESHAPAIIFSAIDPAREVGVVGLLIYFVLNLIKGAEKTLIENQSMSGERDFDSHTVEAIGKLLRISVLITGTLILLQTLGYSISGILAFGGVGGIAVGFAAKDLLSNFFGGLMIYLDRPFKIGDWIRSDDKSIEGTVEHIGWRLTRIRTFDKRPLYVPNSIFTTISVENPSRMTNRRIYETMGIRYDDIGKMSIIIEQVKKMLMQHADIDNQQTMIVNLNSFASSSVDFFVYTFTKTTDWILYHEIKQDVLLKIVKIVEDNGAEFAFATSTLHIQSMPQLEK